MAYIPTKWENSPSTNTPVNADNLNKLESGVKEIHDMAASGQFDGKPGATGAKGAKGDKGDTGASVEYVTSEANRDEIAGVTTVTIKTKVEGKNAVNTTFEVKDGEAGSLTGDIIHEVTLGAGWSIAEGGSARCVERDNVVYLFGGLTTSDMSQKHILTIPVEICPNCTRAMFGVCNGVLIPLFLNMQDGKLYIDPLYEAPGTMVSGTLFFNNNYINQKG